jgi:hypothetical protein
MAETAIYISAASLLISAAALVVSILVAIRTARLTTAQIRTELLTKLYHARVEYRRFIRRIKELRDNPPDPLPPELKELLDSEGGFQKFEHDTEKYRRLLLGPRRNLDSQTLLTMRHHTDAMVIETEDNNTRLDQILVRIRRQ